MLRNVSTRQGFTLLELLIVSVIMLVVTGGAIAALATFQTRQQALVTAKAVQQMFWSAQTKARVREVPNSGCTLQGYRVVVGNSSATLEAMCGVISPPTATSVTLTFIERQKYDYAPGTTASAGRTSYMFWTLERGVNAGGSNPFTIPSPNAPMSTQTLTFCNGGGGTCAGGASTFSLRVNGYGAITNVFSDISPEAIAL